jgi:hypothetical protein
MVAILALTWPRRRASSSRDMRRLDEDDVESASREAPIAVAIPA